MEHIGGVLQHCATLHSRIVTRRPELFGYREYSIARYPLGRGIIVFVGGGYPHRVQRRSIKLNGMLLAVALTAGCQASSHARFLPPKLDRSIEKFDFRDATWISDAGRVTLHNGHSNLPDIPDDEADPQTADITRGPVFADVNGDGAEDAAIELHQGGQGYTLAWYIWLWERGTAVQITEPFIDFSRCSGQVDSVTAVAGGFTVKEMFANPDNPCATGGVVPVTYTVAVRDGFVVQIKPTLGQVPCDPAYMTNPVTVAGPATPRAAASNRAPAIAVDQRYRHTYVGDYELPSSGWTKRWTDVLLDDGTHPPFCGYLHTNDIEFTN